MSVAPPGTLGDDAIAASRSRSLVAAAALALLAFAAVYAVAVLTAWGQRQDEDAMLGRYVSESAHDDVEFLLATISVASLAAIGGGIMLIALMRRRPHLALGAGVLVAGAVLTAEILKHVLPRPDLDVPSSHGQSFPSGHATIALSLALALTLVVPVAIRSVVAIAGLAYALAIGIGVVSAGWHRPSDVLGAYLLTFAWASATCAVLVRRYGPGGDPGAARGARGLATGPLLVGAGIALLAVAALAAAAIVLERRSEEGFQRFGAGFDYALACLVIAALGIGLVGALLWQLRGISLDRPPGPASGLSRDPVDV